MSVIVKKNSEKFKEYVDNPNYRLRLIEGTADQFRLLIRMVETGSISIAKESVETLQTPLNESYQGNNYTARAIIKNVDVTRYIKNLNERIYSRKLWEKVLLSKIAEGSSCLTDHPPDDDPGSVRCLTGVWHNFRLGEDTGKADLYVIGDAGGLMLEAINAGGKVGFSTVGYGEMMEDGITVNPDTYELERLADWVINPSQQVYATKETVIVETFKESAPIRSENSLKEITETMVNIDNTDKLIKEDDTLLSKDNNTNIINKITKESSMSEKLEKINIASYKANLKNQIKESLKKENKKEAFEKICALKEEALEALGVESVENEEVQETADEALETIISDLQSVVGQTKDELETIKVDMGATEEQKKDVEQQLDASKAIIEELKAKYKRVLEIASNIQEEYSKLKEDEDETEAADIDEDDIVDENIDDENTEETSDEEVEEEGASITIGDDIEILINDPEEKVTVTGDAEQIAVETDELSDDAADSEDGDEGENEGFELETEEGLEEAYKKITEKGKNSTAGKAIKKPKTNVKKLNKGKIDPVAKAKYQGTKKPKAKKENATLALFRKVSEAEIPYFARSMSTSTSSTTSHNKNFYNDFAGMTEQEKKEYAAWRARWSARKEAARRKYREADENLDTEGLGMGADAGLDAPDAGMDMGADMGTNTEKDNVEINIKVPTKEAREFAKFKKFLSILPKGKYTEKAIKVAFKKYKEEDDIEIKRASYETDDSTMPYSSEHEKMFRRNAFLRHKAMNRRGDASCPNPLRRGREEDEVYTESQFLKKFGIGSINEVEDITAKVYKNKEMKERTVIASTRKPVITESVVEKYFNTVVVGNPQIAALKEEILKSATIEDAKLKINEFLNKKSNTTEIFKESNISSATGSSYKKSWIPKGLK